MAEVSAPGPAPGPAPPPTGGPPPPPSQGLHGTSGVGGGDHQKGGADKGPSAVARLHEDADGSMFGDYAMLGGGSGALNETWTIHAAISRWLGESDPVVRLSPAQMSEFKKLFDRNHGGRGAASPERNAYIPNDLSDPEWLALGEEPVSDNFGSVYGEGAEPVQLEPALRRPFVELPSELTPQSATDEARLFGYTTDPRAGFAPEGVAAFIAAYQHGVELERAPGGDFDFVDAATKEGWHIAPVRNGAPGPIAELQLAAAVASRKAAHLLFDAAHLAKIDGALGNAVNEFVKNARAKRCRVALGPARMVFSVPTAA